LWIWRLEHPDWTPELDWQPMVASTCVESGGEVAVLDPLAPPDDADEVWARLDAHPPTLAVVLKPDHVRNVDTFVRRYGTRAFGPALFWRDDIPETELEPIEPGSELPGDLVALYDGRGRNETPLWLPEPRAPRRARRRKAPGVDGLPARARAGHALPLPPPARGADGHPRGNRCRAHRGRMGGRTRRRGRCLPARRTRSARVREPR